MSKIYQPPGQPFDPLYVDCLANALARRNLNFTTNSTVFVPVVELELAPNLFDTDGKRFDIEIEGAFAPATTESLEVRFDFDAAPTVTVLVANVSGLATEIKLKLFKAGANLDFYGRVVVRNSATDDNTKVCTDRAVVSGVNFAVQHTLTINARVLLATSNLSLAGLSASVI